MKKQKYEFSINFTDLIDGILISEGHDPLFENINGRKVLISNSTANAIGVVESALATYYNLKVNGELKEAFHIDELPQFKNLNISANYDLDRLER